MKRKAFFITIEGLEGSGKSSVIAFLKRLLQTEHYKVLVLREPGSTKIGEAIRKLLLDKKNKNLSRHTELLLYLAARTQLIEEKLQKALSAYDVVVCDRFFDSTLVYQGYGLGLGAIVEQSVCLFSLGIIPDMTIVLDVAARAGLGRIKHKDRIESRPLRFHNALRKGYRALARKYPRRISIIDASGSLEDIYILAENILRKKMNIFLRKRTL